MNGVSSKIFLVAAWFFGVIFIISACGLILIGDLVAGLAFLIAGFLFLPPTKKLILSKIPSLKKGVITIIALVLVFASPFLTNEKVYLSEDTKVADIDEVPDINNVEPSEYKNLNAHEDLTWLTLFFNARAKDKLSEEELLTIYSKEYAEERDGFKKQELAQALMPQINAELAEYEKDYRVTLPIVEKKSDRNFYTEQNEKKQTDIQPYLPPLQNYDFETKSFPMKKCHFPFVFGHSNEQKVRISVQKSTPEGGCMLYVDDQELARKIETAIVDNEIDMKGDVYYVLSSDKKGELTSESVNVFANPVSAKIVYFNAVTNEELITKEFDFS